MLRNNNQDRLRTCPSCSKRVAVGIQCATCMQWRHNMPPCTSLEECSIHLTPFLCRSCAEIGEHVNVSTKHFPSVSRSSMWQDVEPSSQLQNVQGGAKGVERNPHTLDENDASIRNPSAIRTLKSYLSSRKRHTVVAPPPPGSTSNIAEGTSPFRVVLSAIEEVDDERQASNAYSLVQDRVLDQAMQMSLDKHVAMSEVADGPVHRRRRISSAVKSTQECFGDDGSYKKKTSSSKADTQTAPQENDTMFMLVDGSIPSPQQTQSKCVFLLTDTNKDVLRDEFEGVPFTRNLSTPLSISAPDRTRGPQAGGTTDHGGHTLNSKQKKQVPPSDRHLLQQHRRMYFEDLPLPIQVTSSLPLTMGTTAHHNHPTRKHNMHDLRLSEVVEVRAGASDADDDGVASESQTMDNENSIAVCGGQALDPNWSAPF